jgi:hypothetical protein
MELKGTAKFTDADVQRVRMLGDSRKMSVVELADVYDCGLETIRRLLRRETFRHVPELGDTVREEAKRARRSQVELMTGELPVIAATPTDEEAQASQEKMLELLNPKKPERTEEEETAAARVFELTGRKI